MKVKVKFFSAHREAVGSSEMEVEVDGGTDVNGLLNKLEVIYPELKKLADYTVLSLNHRYAGGSELLKEGDEVAIFPPVEGG